LVGVFIEFWGSWWGRVFEVGVFLGGVWIGDFLGFWEWVGFLDCVFFGGWDG